jgi:hypothetical protein
MFEPFLVSCSSGVENHNHISTPLDVKTGKIKLDVKTGKIKLDVKRGKIKLDVKRGKI